MTHSDILVIAEHHNGRLRPQSFELVTAARTLASETGGEVVVAIAGASPAAYANDLAALDGIARVVAVEHAALDPFTPGPWVSAITQAVEAVNPFAVLIPSSITGRDYAARVAARLVAGLVPDATALSLEDGDLVATRAVLGARVATAVRFVDAQLAIVTVAPGAFPQALVGSGSAPVEQLAVTIDPADCRVVLDSVSDHVAGARALSDAERIVSGGRGLGGPENFALIEDLAAELDAAVGASGATVGAGWRSHNDQAGSTGHIVSPKLYLAVGISGAPQHLVGMQGSEHIVAINRDPDAPIFGLASFGIVGDLFDIVPALLAELRAAREANQE
jgi:electron transfer flavoprotein alpha subunit